jgi:glycosyltransferase involved in cell wall biosynthesis
LAGGAERYMFEWSKILERKDHEVVPFSMEHPRNEKTDYSNYFVNNVDFTGDTSFYSKFKTGLRTIYSIEARKKLKTLIKDTKPDIAHVNAFCYQLTPSILYAMRETGIPIICRTPEYKFICPNQRLFNLYTGKICEDCKGGRYYKALSNRCIKNSFYASLLGCVDAYLNKWLKTYEKIVDLIITPSRFMHEKMIEFGMEADKIVHIPNFIEVENYRPNYGFKDYIVYFGGLLPNKGLETLLRAMKLLEEIELKIIGEGEVGEQLKQKVEREKIGNVNFMGYKSGDKLISLIRESMFTVLPSEMYENCPFSVLESLALGKPVIGANIGGIPELIEDEVDGLIFEPKNVEDLAEKIKYLSDHKDILPEMGIKGRKKIEERYNSEIYYEKMIKIYEDAMEKRRTIT